MTDVNAAIEKNKKEAARAPPGLKAKLLKHAALMESELAEPPPEDEEDEPASAPAASSPPAKALPTHESLMQNEVYSYCYSELLELKDAFMYLRDLGENERMEAVMKKAEACQGIVNRFKAGEVSSSYVAPLIPQDLLGVGEQERLAKLEEISSKMQETFSQYKDKAVAALRMGDKAAAVQHKGKMQRFEKFVKIVAELRLNPWQPLPILTNEETRVEEPVSNPEIGENDLIIILGEATGFAEGEYYYAVCALPLNSPAVYNFTTKQVRDVTKNGFNHIEKVVLDPRVYPSLERRRLNIEVFQHRTLRSDASLGSTVVKLTDLAAHCTVEGKFPLGRGGPTVKVILQVRKALKANEVKTVAYQELVITKIPPPFKKADGSYFAERQAPPVQERQAPPVQQRQPMVEEEKKTVARPQQPAGAPQQPVAGVQQGAAAPAALLPEELKDPTVLNNLNSFEVLEAEKERLTQLISQARDRDENPAPLIAKQREVLKKLTLIQVQVDQGRITMEEYTKVLNESVAHDIELAKYFKAQGDEARLRLVVERVKLMRKELAEIASAPPA